MTELTSQKVIPVSSAFARQPAEGAFHAVGVSTGYQNVLAALTDTSDGALVRDRHGRVVLWNQAAEKITGRRSADVIGRPCWQVMGGRDPLGNMVCFQGCFAQKMALRGEHPSNYDLLVTHASGNELWLNVSTILIRDEEGTLEAVIHLFHDVTARRSMEIHLRRILNEQLHSLEPPTRSMEQLTSREREILKHLAAGLPNHTIAHRLSISRATVRNHIQKILNKLGVHSKLEAVVLVHRHRL